MAALIARLRDFQLAEEALQEAAISAVSHWGRTGVPQSPQGWLLKVALRKAIDRIRIGTRETRKASELSRLAVEEAAEMTPEAIPDERLSLIFTCCHPALEQKSQVALTLRTVCGLTTQEIAQAFLDVESTMGQRLSRAKAKIAAAGIPFAIPEPETWGERLQAVLTVIYLIYNAGYTAGPNADRDLCEEAIFLARILNGLRAGEAEVEGCLALMLLSHGRKHARVDAAGITVPPQDQDRSLWDMAMLTEGDTLVRNALAKRQLGPNQIKAAIAACHALPERPDWPQIRLLYETLLRFEPTDVVRLNLAVAMSES
ncbi:MAG: RNA polymerase sigma factor, partial [Paracoccaceae bacterium]